MSLKNPGGDSPWLEVTPPSFVLLILEVIPLGVLFVPRGDSPGLISPTVV